MLISEQKRFVFVHIPKTAGTSVMEVFLPHSRLRDRAFHGWVPTRKLIRFAIDRCGWNAGRTALTGFHKHCRAVEVRDRMGAERYASYFAFSFVRNPFDAIESLYHFIRQSEAHPRHRKVSSMRFGEFVARTVAAKPLRQIDYLSDPDTGKMLVDYVGRFETLPEDVAAIAERIGIPYRGALSHRNSGRLKQRDAAENGYDESSVRLVAEYFAADLETFGYGREGFSSAPLARWMDRGEGGRA